jgi:hypothetical protein
MKLAHVAIFALVSLVVTASPCGSNDFEQIAIQFPEQASENVVVDGVHDDWPDMELTATSCTCAGQYQVLRYSDVRLYRSSMASRKYSTAYVDNSVKAAYQAAYRANPHPTTDA